jgi:hypothetical protein
VAVAKGVNGLELRVSDRGLHNRGQILAVNERDEIVEEFGHLRRRRRNEFRAEVSCVPQPSKVSRNCERSQEP